MSSKIFWSTWLALSVLLAFVAALIYRFESDRCLKATSSTATVYPAGETTILPGASTGSSAGKRLPADAGNSHWELVTGALLAGAGSWSVAMALQRRRKAEEAPRASEAEHRALLEQLPPGTWVYKAAVDDYATTLYVGPQVKVLGFSRLEWTEGRDFWSRQLHPDDRARVLDAFRMGRDMDGPLVCEYRMLAKDGTVRWFRDHAVVVRGDSGGPLYWQGVMTDVTERRMAEEELARHRDHLEDLVAERTARMQSEIAARMAMEEKLLRSAEEIQDLYDNAPCGYHSLDMDGVIVRINNTELAWLGYSREEVLGKKITDFVTPAGVELFRENFPLLMERGWVRDLEFELARKDGSTIPVLLSATAIKDGRGGFVMTRSTLYDLTERKKVDDALRAARELYRRQFKAVPVPTYIWSRLGDGFVLTDYNDAAEEITRGGITRFVGADLKEMFADRPDIIDDTMSCFSEGRQVRREFWYTMKSTGERRYLDVTYNCAPPDMVLVYTEDRTEHRLAEEELARHRDHLEELVKERTVALEKEIEVRERVERELRNSCDMVADLLLRIERARDDEREKTVRDIHDDVGQLLTAIHYDLKHIENNLPDGAVHLGLVAKNSDNLVNQVVERIQRIAAGLHPPLLDALDIVAAMEWRAIEFEKETGIACSVVSDPAALKLDKDLSRELFKVFAEALNNVGRHSGATEAKVTLTQAGDDVRLEIRDNGKGFRPESVYGGKITGLAGMKARLHPWGGILDVRGELGEGTTVSASLTLGKRIRGELDDQGASS